MNAGASNGVFQQWLKDEIRRHRLWRQIWSFCYFANASMTIVAGALTTVSSVIQFGGGSSVVQTTLLAATTTVLASLEKVLRLREKWDLHRNLLLTLEFVEMKVDMGAIEPKQAVAELEKASISYSQKLSDLSKDDED